MNVIVTLQHMRHDQFLAGQFKIGPIHDGHALTVANALRRSLLCDIYGAAFVLAYFPHNVHEYEHAPGVQETIMDVLLNLKKVSLASEFEMFPPQKAVLDFSGPGRIYAEDIELPCFLTLVNPKVVLAHVTEKAHVYVEFLVGSGHGSAAPIADHPEQDLYAYVQRHQNLSKLQKPYGKGGKHNGKTQRQNKRVKTGLESPPRHLSSPWVGRRKLTWLYDFGLPSLNPGLQAPKINASQNVDSSAQDNQVPKLKGYYKTKSFKTSQKAADFVWGTKDGKGRRTLAMPPYEVKTKAFQHQSPTVAIDLPRRPDLDTRGYFLVSGRFNPIVRVNYTLEDQAGLSLDQAYILMEIWSNGGKHPKDALYQAASAAMAHFAPFQRSSKS